MNKELLLDAGEDLAEDLVASGLSEDKAVDSVAKFLDKIVPLDVLIPGPVGVIAEELDGAAFKRVVKALAEVFKRDPEQRAARQAERAERQAKNQERRKLKKKGKGAMLDAANPRRS